MVGWHHRFDGRQSICTSIESEQAQGVGDGCFGTVEFEVTGAE